MLSESVKNEIIDSLKPVDPFLVILFGSYAWGMPGPDSDIDLYVVTKDNIFPVNYQENFNIKKIIYLALSNFRKKYATDLIVHSLPVHRKFAEMESSFSKEIFNKGIILINEA